MQRHDVESTLIQYCFNILCYIWRDERYPTIRRGRTEKTLLSMYRESKALSVATRKRTLNAFSNSSGSDQPAHPHSLVRAIAVRTHRLWTLKNTKAVIALHGVTDWFESRVKADDKIFICKFKKKLSLSCIILKI